MNCSSVIKWINLDNLQRFQTKLTWWIIWFWNRHHNSFCIHPPPLSLSPCLPLSRSTTWPTSTLAFSCDVLRLLIQASHRFRSKYRPGSNTHTHTPGFKPWACCLEMSMMCSNANQELLHRGGVCCKPERIKAGDAAGSKIKGQEVRECRWAESFTFNPDFFFYPVWVGKL